MNVVYATNRLLRLASVGSVRWNAQGRPAFHGHHSDFVFNNLSKPWHHPNFLSEASIEQKENWLATLDQRDTQAYLVVLRALASIQKPDSAHRAERWLIRLERQYDSTNDASLRPNAECYQRVVEAWAAVQVNPEIALLRAERWLHKHWNSPIEDMRPTTATFNAFLDACSKGRAHKQTNGRSTVWDNAKKAYNTLQFMIQHHRTYGDNSLIAPNTDSFNYVIRAWTRCRHYADVADRAMDALKLLEQQTLMDPSVQPNAKSYAMVMDAISVKAKFKVKQCQDIKDPSQNGFDEIKLLNNILDYMREKSQADPSVAPNSSAYNILCSTWAHLSKIHSNGPHQAERVLQHMIALKDQGDIYAVPDSITYQTVMRAWKNSDRTNRGHRVAWWLNKNWKDFEFEGSRELQPTVATYNVVIQVWADLGKPQRAEETLCELIEHAQHETMSPNTESYAAVIRAYLAQAERGDKHALFMACRWLDAVAECELSDESISTSVEWYTRVLGVARNCADVDVLDLAIDVFRKLRKSHHSMDCVHYSRLLQVGLLALSEPRDDQRRDSFLERVLSDCCEHGYLGRSVVRVLVNGPVFYSGWTILESSRFVHEFLDWPFPSSWTRNVKPKELPSEGDLVRVNFNVLSHGENPFLTSNASESF